MNAISMLSLPETQNQNPWQDSFTLERNTCRMKLAHVNKEEHTVLFVVTVSFQPSVNLKNMFYCDIHASLKYVKGQIRFHKK